jgi:hypothetical protein
MHGFVVFPLIQDASVIFNLVTKSIPHDTSSWEYIQSGPPSDEDIFVPYPDENKPKSWIQVPLCEHCPAGIIKQWREHIVGWNEVINQKFRADMESTCTLQMAKVLFNSEDDPPTEQYLHSDYDYIPDRVHIEKASPLIQENI